MYTVQRNEVHCCLSRYSKLTLPEVGNIHSFPCLCYLVTENRVRVNVSQAINLLSLVISGSLKILRFRCLEIKTFNNPNNVETRLFFDFKVSKNKSNEDGFFTGRIESGYKPVAI